MRSLGPVGETWLERLPAALSERCSAWQLELGEPFAAGSHSAVFRVTAQDGRPAVLKMTLPDVALEAQAAVLAAAQGRGYVQLLDADLPSGALLLEALGAPYEIQGPATVPDFLSLTAKTLHQAWQLPLAASVPPAEHKAAWLYTFVDEVAGSFRDLEGTPFIETALLYAKNRLDASDPARQVMVHGDPHGGNLLPVLMDRPNAETGYVFVDPDGFPCEAEYDLGVALREWNTLLLALDDPRAQLRTWCELVADLTELDAQAVWEWAYLERVSTGLYLRHHGLPQLVSPFFEVARRLL